MDSASGSQDSPKISQKIEPLTFGSLDLTQFAYSPKSSTNLASSPLRRSPRKSSARIKAEDSLPVLSDGGETKPVKRSVAIKSETGSPPKKLKRTYAAPETYAHLSGLNDSLKEDLDGRPLIIWSNNLLTRVSSDVLWNKVSVIVRI
jgi:hypothetical protein